MALVGYLHQTKTEVVGEMGTMYSYIMAANGVFIHAENEHLWATLPVNGFTQPAEWPDSVRGLLPLEPVMILKHGRVPQAIWREVAGLLFTVGAEIYVAIVHEDGRYRAVLPDQVGKSGSVKYSKVPGAIIEVHSHPPGMLFFSGTDDDDELGFGLYGVACWLADGTFQSQWRCGIYGHFALAPAGKIFEGGYL